MRVVDFPAPSLHTGFRGSLEEIQLIELNGDGELDIIVLASGHVYSILGRGDGTFSQPSQVYETSAGSLSSLALGDINEDSQMDMIVSEEETGKAQILFGNGRWKF